MMNKDFAFVSQLRDVHLLAAPLQQTCNLHAGWYSLVVVVVIVPKIIAKEEITLVVKAGNS